VSNGAKDLTSTSVTKFNQKKITAKITTVLMQKNKQLN
jgi:hypothetical protein